MTPYEQGRKFYKEQWTAKVVQFARDHFLYSSPTAIALAKELQHCWFIEFMAGDMREALGHLPHWKPQIAFSRRGRIRSYWTATLVNKLLTEENFSVKATGNDSVKDGFADEAPVWRWWRWEDKTASSAITHHCG